MRRPTPFPSQLLAPPFLGPLFTHTSCRFALCCLQVILTSAKSNMLRLEDKAGALVREQLPCDFMPLSQQHISVRMLARSAGGPISSAVAPVVRAAETRQAARLGSSTGWFRNRSCCWQQLSMLEDTTLHVWCGQNKTPSLRWMQHMPALELLTAACQRSAIPAPLSPGCSAHANIQ